MSATRYIIGLETGSAVAKIGVASYPAGSPGNLTLQGVRTAPTVDSVRYGRVTNVRELERTLRTLVQEAEGCPDIEGRRILGVYLGIGGRTLRSMQATSRLVLPDRREITDTDISRLKDQALGNVPSNREVLAVESLQYTVDNIRTNRPEGTLGRSLSGSFTIVMCDPANIRDLETVIGDRMGLDICGMTVRPLALARLVLTPQETFAGCMLIDLGAETITAAIYKTGNLQYLATLPLGSRLITRDLSAALGYDEEESERIKINMGSAISEPGSTPGRQQHIDAVVQARVADLVANIAAQPGFARLTAGDLGAGIVLAGGGARLRNFSRRLELATGMAVRHATLPHDITLGDCAVAPVDCLDLLGTLTESAWHDDSQGGDLCLSAPPAPRQPQPQPAPEPRVSPAPGQQPDVTDGDEKPDDPYYTPGGGFYVDEPPHHRESAPNEIEEVDSDFLLKDDDVADRLRQESDRRAARQAAAEEARRLNAERQRAQKEEREAQKRRKRLERRQKPNLGDRIMRRVTSILGGDNDDNSADM